MSSNKRNYRKRCNRDGELQKQLTLLDEQAHSGEMSVPDWITAKQLVRREIAMPSVVREVGKERAEERDKGSSIDLRNISYLQSRLVAVNLPYKDPGTSSWKRVSNNVVLRVESGKVEGPDGEDVSLGVPFGIVPRRFYYYICSQVVKYDQKEIFFGENFANFMRDIGATDGGNNRRHVAYQLRKLFKANVSITQTYQEESGAGREREYDLKLAESFDVMWNPEGTIIDESDFSKSHVVLKEGFFEEVRKSSIPVDTRILRALGGSPFGYDLYSFITYRRATLRTDYVDLPYRSLMDQFGSKYPNTKDGRKNFKALVLDQMERIEAAWSPGKGDAPIYEQGRGCLRVFKGNPSVPRHDKGKVLVEGIDFTTKRLGQSA